MICKRYKLGCRCIWAIHTPLPIRVALHGTHLRLAQLCHHQVVQPGIISRLGPWTMGPWVPSHGDPGTRGEGPRFHTVSSQPSRMVKKKARKNCSSAWARKIAEETCSWFFLEGMTSGWQCSSQTGGIPKNIWFKTVQCKVAAD